MEFILRKRLAQVLHYDDEGNCHIQSCVVCNPLNRQVARLENDNDRSMHGNGVMQNPYLIQGNNRQFMYRVIHNQFVRDLSNYPFQVDTKKIAKWITARQAVKEISNGSRI